MSTTLPYSAAADLIPLAMLNAFVYCPRRFHYEFVQGVMQDSADVVHGRRKHARVDAPALAERPRSEGNVIHTRSVWLSSDLVGITGKIDVVEEANGHVVPVEYKRGRPPSSRQCPAGYWPNDAAQLCAQAMLLEEAEKTRVARGFLYFAAAHKRVEVSITDDLRALTRHAIAQAQAVAAQDSEPAPLLDSPKCPACSLVALCMPDETNRLHAGDGARRGDLANSPIPDEPLRCLIPRDYDTCGFRKFWPPLFRKLWPLWGL